MFHLEKDFKGNPCLRYEGKIGNEDGESKTDRDGLNAAKTITVSVFIYDEELAYGINPFRVLMNHRERCELTGNKVYFFLPPNHHWRTGKLWLTKVPIGVHSFAKYWKEIVAATEVRGIGPYEKPVLHSLRKNLVNNLMRRDFTDTRITLRTGHKSVQSLQSYANITGEAGMDQQRAILRRPETATENDSKKQKVSESASTPDLGNSSEIGNAIRAVAQNSNSLGNVSIHFHMPGRE